MKVSEKKKHMKVPEKRESHESFRKKNTKRKHMRGLKKNGCVKYVTACRRVQHGDTYNTSTKEVHHFSREKLPQLSMGSEVWGEVGGVVEGGRG